MTTASIVGRSLAAQGRRIRRPQHTFQIRSRPWVIQPFLLAPVLPGETMRNLLLQARVVTDPVAHPLIGWWQEYYIFYVKHRDLDERDTLTAMMLDPDQAAPNTATADARYYHAANSPAWAKMCLKRVVEEFFRDEGEAWNDFVIDTMPIASIAQEGIAQSFMLDDDMDTADVAIPVTADIDPGTGGDQPGVYYSQLDAAQRQWIMLRESNLTDMSYEDYLATYGVRPNVEEIHRPELIRYVRSWQYPSNTIDPTDGSPSSAVSWSIAERADKDRFFREPGFVFGVSVTRPKVYLRGQDGVGAGAMTNAVAWLPAILSDDMNASFVKLAADRGPFQTVVTDSDGYWLDVKDLLIHGDQFINFDPSAVTNGSFVDLPTANGALRKYADADDANALFADGDGSPVQYIRQDGIVTMQIAGRLTDTSRRTIDQV